MRRSWAGFAAAVVIGTALVTGLRAQEAERSTRSALRGSSAAASRAARVVFTFKDDEQMRAFATLWAQRERSMARLGTLQEYWAQEQRDLARLQQRLAEYQVDAAKSYVLDPDRKVLVEADPSSSK